MLQSIYALARDQKNEIVDTACQNEFSSIGCLDSAVEISRS